MAKVCKLLPMHSHSRFYLYITVLAQASKVVTAHFLATVYAIRDTVQNATKNNALLAKYQTLAYFGRCFRPGGKTAIAL
jgi:hypothetical protein